MPYKERSRRVEMLSRELEILATYHEDALNDTGDSCCTFQMSNVCF